jgi:hypothetical protein
MDMETKSIASPRLVFPHIMKTGGTSLIEWIQRHYFVDDILETASCWNHLKGTPAEELRRKRFIRGHFGSGILNVFGPRNGFAAIAMVRDPVERVISHYWHLKNAPDAGIAGWDEDEPFTFEAYVDHPLTRFAVSNYQTANYSAGIGVGSGGRTSGILEELSPLDLARCKAFIDSCDAVGTTEDLPRFVDALTQRFGFFPDSSLQKHRSYRQDESFPKDVLQRIRKLNAADYELYQYVRARSTAQVRSYSLPARVNPNRVDADGTLRWRAGEPYWGRGWADCAGEEKHRHIWSLEGVASMCFDVEVGETYVLLVYVMRFVVPFQGESFVINCDGRELVPTKVPFPETEGQVYAVSLGQAKSAQLTVGFAVDRLLSFNEVNAADKDTLLRGVAIHSVTLIGAGSGEA